jgi:cell division inhibitor SepF
MGNFMNKLTGFLGIPEQEFENEIDEAIPTQAEEDSITYSSKRSKVVNIHTTTQLKVVVIQPTNYQDAQEIADHLKSKKPVVVNLEKLDREIAVKIVNFLSGAVYALGGSMQKISNGILLLAPYNVGIMGDFSDELKLHGAFELE